MLIGQRLRDIRDSKKLSQGYVARETGFVRPYISRVENGHTVPSIETLEKWARALGVPVYQVLYEGERPPKALKVSGKEEKLWGNSRREAQELGVLLRSLEKMSETDRKLLLALAGRMVHTSRAK